MAYFGLLNATYGLNDPWFWVKLNEVTIPRLLGVISLLLDFCMRIEGDVDSQQHCEFLGSVSRFGRSLGGRSFLYMI